MNFDANLCETRPSERDSFTIPKLTILEVGLSKITESEFREYAKNDAIKTATVIKTDEGYILVVELTWKEGRHTLHTFRNRPRAWASLDRMMAYMERHELKLKSISLQLH
jgi:hypothetical protein